MFIDYAWLLELFPFLLSLWIGACLSKNVPLQSWNATKAVLAEGYFMRKKSSREISDKSFLNSSLLKKS